MAFLVCVVSLSLFVQFISTQYCDEPCSDITFGRPCMHMGIGDTTCFDYMDSVTQICPPGTFNCNSSIIDAVGSPSMAPTYAPTKAPIPVISVCMEPCSNLTLGLPCMNIRLDDHTCHAYIANIPGDICPAGTIDCTKLSASNSFINILKNKINQRSFTDEEIMIVSLSTSIGVFIIGSLCCACVLCIVYQTCLQIPKKGKFQKITDDRDDVDMEEVSMQIH